MKQKINKLQIAQQIERLEADLNKKIHKVCFKMREIEQIQTFIRNLRKLL